MKDSDEFDWNDLKYFLALARHGSTLAAGRALGVDASTVQRRLTELQRRLGQRLVQRHATGYRLTELGQGMVPAAESVQAAVDGLRGALSAAAAEVSGVLRVTCPEPIMKRLVDSRLFDRFQARYPALQLAFVISDRYVDLAQGEADVALRSGDTDGPELVGRKIGDSFWAVYASKGYIARCGRPATVEEMAAHALVGLDDSMAGHRAAAWLRRVAPAGRLAARNNSVLGLLYSAKAGLGLAPLPTALGDAEPELVRVLGPIYELTRIWRVLAPVDRRRTPRVAAFFDFVVEEIEALRPIITG